MTARERKRDGLTINGIISDPRDVQPAGAYAGSPYTVARGTPHVEITSTKPNNPWGRGE